MKIYVDFSAKKRTNAPVRRLSACSDNITEYEALRPRRKIQPEADSLAEVRPLSALK